MRSQELQAFLRSVGHRRFVDYLDPSGETAQSAFDRRLSWARVSQHDPVTMDEALFLLRNTDPLRDVLRKELAEDDWIEETAAGGEWGAPTAPKRPKSKSANPKVQEFFAASERARSSAPGSTAPAAPPEEDLAIEEEFHAPLDANSYVNWDEDEDEDDVETRIAHISELGVTPAAVPEETPETQATVRMSRDDIQNTLSGLDSLSGDPPSDQLVYVPPAPKRPPPRAYDYDPGDPEPEPIAEPPRRATPLPIPDRSIEVSLDQRATPARAVRTRTPMPARSAMVASADDDAPRTSMNIRATRSGRGSRRRGGRPLILVALAVMAMLTLVVGVGVVGVALLTMVDTDGLLADLGLGGDDYESVLGAPDAYDPDLGFDEEELSDEAAMLEAEEEPDPGEEALEPVEADPIVAAPAPAPAPAPEPVARVAPRPTPAPAPVRPAPRPAPVARPTPKPSPRPAPAPQPIAARTVPEPAPAPAPAAPATPPKDFRGLWLGTGDGRGLKLTIRSQNGAKFSGIAEMQKEDGTWATLEISGTIGTDGGMSFKGGSTGFSGTLSGMRAQGRYTVTAGTTPKTWSVINVN